MSDLMNTLKNLGCIELTSRKQCQDFLALKKLNKGYYRFGQYCHTPEWSKDLAPHRFHIITLAKTHVTDKEKCVLFIKALIYLMGCFAVPFILISALSTFWFFSLYHYEIIVLVMLLSLFVNVNIKNYQERNNYLLLDRLAGTVTHHSSASKATIVDFHEMKAFLRPSTNAYGKRYFTLFMIEEKSNKLYTLLVTGQLSIAKLYWDFLRYFMDIQNPLPDIPNTEPFRFLDPATKAFDKTYSRDPYYYRNMCEETFNALQQRARESCRRFYDI